MRTRVVVIAAMIVAVVGVPAQGLSSEGVKAGDSFNMEVVGRNDLGGRGFNGDVWVHEGHAYVGRWGFSDWAPGGEDRFCPSDHDGGVAVVDATDPTSPLQVADLAAPPGTSAEDVVAFSHQSGIDVAVIGIQVCGGSRRDPSFFRGLVLYDVTVPSDPHELGRLNSGCCTRGVHEFEVRHRPDLNRTFVYASVPGSEYPDSASPTGVRDQQRRGDFRLIDITDPAHPTEVSDWGVVKDLGGPTQPGRGCDQDPIFGHSAEPSDDGRTAFVSYWDSGFIALDVSDPSDPTYLGNTVYPANADGDAHSSSYDDASRILFTGDEDFCKTSGPGTEKGFGYLRVYDFSDPSRPRQIGVYKTPNSQGTADPGAGDYTIHNPLVVGDVVYASWYSDGVRVLDVSNPREPREIAYFVPPAAANPVKPSQRGVLSNTAQVWGVVVDDGLVYISDMNSGLWILRVS